jgi:formylglycine-generating enzyme required for sulfatase activity
MRLLLSLLAPLLLGSALGADLTLSAQERAPGTTFRDCPDCPEMVVVPAGKFLMGSPSTETGRDIDGTEDPHHEVTIARPFAVAKYETTRDEYARFVKETALADPPGCNVHQVSPPHWPTIEGLNWHNTGFTQTGRDPVVCMSWNEAVAYVAWLSKKTGKSYRLLSEAEWEYAARAGTTTPDYWGDRRTPARTPTDRIRRGRIDSRNGMRISPVATGSRTRRRSAASSPMPSGCTT